jgi:mono/diheme cytochrome c family protein
MTKPIFLVFAVLTFLLTACGAGATSGSPTDTSAVASVSFSKDVMPILQSRCLSCHGGGRANRGLSFDTYDTLMAGSNNGPVIIPGNPNGSRLIQLVQSGTMPKQGPKLTPDQIQILIDWILAGALNN